MRRHKSVKVEGKGAGEGGGGLREREREGAGQILSKQTHHKCTRWGERKGGHISYSPANVIDMGVCVSGCVCHAGLPPCSPIRWLQFLGIPDGRLIFSRATSHALQLEAQHLRRTRYPGITEERKSVKLTQFREDFQHRDTKRRDRSGKVEVHGEPLFCCDGTLWTRS